MPDPGAIQYFAIGTIDYEHADHAKATDNGTIIYIKPAYHGTEGAGIRSYATANPDFPHESTANQWFTDQQFESYRLLGQSVAAAALAAQGLPQEKGLAVAAEPDSLRRVS